MRCGRKPPTIAREGSEKPELATGSAQASANNLSQITGGRVIKVWKFDEAPKKYQALSTNGGDEDWIALVPKSMSEEWIGWLEKGTSFGCPASEEHKLKNGDVIRIGCHS